MTTCHPSTSIVISPREWKPVLQELHSTLTASVLDRDHHHAEPSSPFSGRVFLTFTKERHRKKELEVSGKSKTSQDTFTFTGTLCDLDFYDLEPRLLNFPRREQFWKVFRSQTSCRSNHILRSFFLLRWITPVLLLGVVPSGSQRRPHGLHRSSRLPFPSTVLWCRWRGRWV